jgi:putative protein-disulfide isomerase
MHTLITVFDPLCGWCYGFGPVLTELESRYAGRLNFDIFCGGMITGARIGPLAHMASFISQAYKAVEEYSGVRFGEAFLGHTLREGKATFSSLEPSKVLTVYRALRKTGYIRFSHEIQKLIYFDGIDPVDYKAYLPLFQREGLDAAAVMPLLQSADVEQETIREFGLAQRWGITGFPSCVMQLPDGKAIRISHGYEPLARLEEKIRPYLS